MKILVVGGGGREHAVIKALKRSEHNLDIICAPGNGGIAALVPCFPVKAEDVDGMVELAIRESVDFGVVTPDDPLALGMVDALEKAGVKAFGPSACAARIESSKTFAKEIMKKAKIPTARSCTFTNYDDAKAYIEKNGAPIVLKADGLAKGKGVIVAMTLDEAYIALDSIMRERHFGDAGAQVLIEEYLTGTEMSVMCFSDGEHIKIMPSSQDHKRLLDGDCGPNTGGMGAFARSPIMTDELLKNVENNILLPAINTMNREGCPFKGVLYAGLMITDRGPYVLEFNARFGDPETQVVLELLESDLCDIMLACRNGELDKLNICWSKDSCAVIILASAGYPEKSSEPELIHGLDAFSTITDGGVIHAGTKCKADGYYTAGGRVLGIYARAETLSKAVKKAYEYVNRVSFNGMQYRRDIGSAYIGE